MLSRYLLAAGWLLCAIAPLLMTPAPLAAQTSAPAEEAQPAAAEVDPEVAEMLATPRAAVSGLLKTVNEGNLNRAAHTLDLSAFSKPVADVKGPDLAFKLKAMLDRIARIELDEIPDGAEAASPYPLGEKLADAANLQGAARRDAQQIRLARSAEGHWRFDSKTVAAIEKLWNRWQDKARVEGLAIATESPTFSVWLARQFPPSWRETHFLLPDYQWLSLLALIFLGFVADALTRVVLNVAAHAWFRHMRAEDGVTFDTKLFRPIGLLVQALVWYVGTRLIGLPPLALLVLLVALKFFAVVAGIWTAFLLIDLLSAYLGRHAAKTETKFDDLLIPLVSKSLKVFAVCIGVLTGADALGLPLAGLVGGTAIGGLALAMASKDAVSNLFGSVTVLVDRPFEVGDWIIMDGAEGSIETVGFRSTRIRTFYNSQITVPNSLLTTAIVDNMGRRRYRRVKTIIGLQYDTTPEQMDAFCEGVRELIRRHPYTRKDYYHVYFNDFSDSALNVLLYCFLECPDWGVELRERHRLLNDITRLARELGCQFAFPTRTLHLFQEQPGSSPPSIADSERLGQTQAARIAGPLQSGDDRPGPVVYGDPSPVEDFDPETERKPKGDDSGE